LKVFVPNGEKEGQASMELSVPPDLEALVQERLGTGAFANAEEVIRPP
jgi:Arc/MetJ-type ribon-helix-helix transcriptional regulator